MKLRVRQQSVRFRLSPEDVASLGRGESVVMTLCLGPNQRFSYGLKVAQLASLGVESTSSGVVILCPADLVKHLAETEEVGFERVIEFGEGDSLRVLVEKDFQCLVPRGEDDGNTFPNPNTKP